jgi:entericidin B
MLRNVLSAAALAGLLLSAAACNTVKGMGEDIQSVGRAGEKAIN